MNTEETNLELSVVTEKLCKIVNESNLSSSDMMSVLVQFLFSIGASLEKCESQVDSDDVLKRYYKSPTLGYALMAQALWMKDTWQQGLKDVKDS